MKNDSQEHGSLYRLANYCWENVETVVAAGILVAISGLFAKFYHLEQRAREDSVPVQVSPLEGIAQQSTAGPVSSVTYGLGRESGSQ